MTTIPYPLQVLCCVAAIGTCGLAALISLFNQLQVLIYCLNVYRVQEALFGSSFSGERLTPGLGSVLPTLGEGTASIAALIMLISAE